MASDGGLFVGKRGAMWRGYALIAPLLLFLMATFLVPAGLIVWRSVADPEMQVALPATAAALSVWDGRGLPGAQAETALAADLKTADRAALASLSRRLSYEDAGFRALLQSTKRALDGGKTLPLASINPKWADNGSWQIMKRQALQPWVGLPNILLREMAVPELLQHEATPERLASSVLDWLEAPDTMAAVQQKFTALHHELRRDTATLATDAIAQVLAA